MTLQERINVLERLGKVLKDNGSDWQFAKQQANQANPWFVPEFIEMATDNIVRQFLQKEKLESWAKQYCVPEYNEARAAVGLVMAGNIPMVGFHDMLCVFVTGHTQKIKLSSKDDVLMRYIVRQMVELEPAVQGYISITPDNLKGCNAYIATGSNNSSRYFDYYFGKFPSIIRKNRTSVAVLAGTETKAELEKLADDIQSYFGLGCRNVTKLYVPENYRFEDLLETLNKYDYYADFHKYKNNYDYQLALLIMGNNFYMTNGSIILCKNPSLFTPVSRVNYEYYNKKDELQFLQDNQDVQCVVGQGFIPFGKSQEPSLNDYADGVDTMRFLLSI